MHSNINYRQSRRSACDRCRGFKLRCERDHASNRSCERCLKAQAVCTTSLSHPVSTLSQSNPTDHTLSSQYVGGPLGYDRLYLNALHKTTASRVKKHATSSNTFRFHANQEVDPWTTCEPWITSWANNTVPSPYAYWPLKRADTDHSPTTGMELNAFANGNLNYQEQLQSYGYYDIRNEHISVSASDTISSLQSSLSRQIQPEVEKIELSDEICNSISSTNNEGATPDDSPLYSAKLSPAADLNADAVQRRLLRLSLAILDDIDSLETDEGSVYTMETCINSTNDRLDDLILRMLTHSTELLTTLNFDSAATNDQLSLSCTKDLGQWSPRAQLWSTNQFISTEGLAIGRAPPLFNSGHTTPRSPSPATMGTVMSPERVYVYLSMLTAYQKLIRYHHIVYSELNKFIINADFLGEMEICFPQSLSFIQAKMDSNEGVQLQLQALVHAFSDLLNKLQSGLQSQFQMCGGANRSIHSSPSSLDHCGLAFIHKFLTKQDGIDPNNELQEKLNTLNNLVLGSSVTWDS
ncbi:Fungal Zn(2)-Cys(6) binuclear cluster domain-containing protein [Penicillium ucsense]|uniref:Fungal Zn(2)-Cys(6) binuclear cluster domain-containing protein n=1 Tax=Penicillium ucsense TaxID=2839758 RepID=A0A8J8WGB9_9EURO|nr:Fungal Zn(2)-Cys(6) binuclear cluster domain-containing protein [Penicillium ucsense]KAF7737602.1 Fungal Zn(2)-Cys(6) binuclear cluster domain-containing protein [Penicillium ucsense]